jgi:hypothetical protein
MERFFLISHAYTGNEVKTRFWAVHATTAKEKVCVYFLFKIENFKQKINTNLFKDFTLFQWYLIFHR